MTRQPERPVTLADVARSAGFSLSTASLVFRDSPLVADSTRARVTDTARELGYVYNRRAAGLRTQRSNTIGLLISGLANPFFGDLTEAVEVALVPSGYTLLLGNTLEDRSRQSNLINTLLEYRVDGLLIVPSNGSSDDVARELSTLRVPHVFLTRRAADHSFAYVGSNDELAGWLAAMHLHLHGARSIAYFGGPDVAEVRAGRQRGALRACRETGMRFVPEWSVRTVTSSAAGHDAATGLLRSHPLPDGVIVHSDAIAFGVMRAITDAGIRVGQDVGIIGFDDVEHAKEWSPGLTSVAVDARLIGQAAVDMLLGMIDGGTRGTSTTFEPELRVRESCGPH